MGKFKWTCKHPSGCTKHAQKGGVCWTHGAKAETKRCSFEGCEKPPRKGGVCWTHGAKAETKRCSVEGCTKYVQKGGVCVTHGAKRKRCSFEGCTKYPRKGGLCWTHGAKMSTNPTNTANPPSSSTGANSTSDTATTTTTTTTEQDMEEENHGNVGESTTAVASDLPVGVETQAESAQPPQPQELPTCNHERCNTNTFREGFCIYHLRDRQEVSSNYNNNYNNHIK